MEKTNILSSVDINFGKDVNEDINLPITRISKGRVSREVLYCELGRQRDEYEISIITVIVVISAIFLTVYNLLKYTSQSLYGHDIDLFIVQIFVVLVFIFSGFSLHNIFVNRKMKVSTKFEQIAINCGLGLGFGAIGLVIQTTIKSVFLSVSSIDYFLFYLCVAVGEEVFFRFGLLPTIKILFNFNKVFASVVSVFTSAFLFTLYHSFVYESLIDLGIVFIMGCLFGFIFEWTKSLDTALVAHIMLNIIAGINFVNLVYGGF